MKLLQIVSGIGFNGAVKYAFELTGKRPNQEALALFAAEGEGEEFNTKLKALVVGAHAARVLALAHTPDGAKH